MATYNNFKSTTIRGQFQNLDYGDNSILASGNFQRDLNVGNNLSLGLEISSTGASGVITYTDTGGNISFKLSGVTYTLTPTILKYLSTLNLNSIYSAINTWTKSNTFKNGLVISTNTLIPTALKGTITLTKINQYDVSSVVFQSARNNNSDYASIEYYDDVYNTNKNYFGQTALS